MTQADITTFCETLGRIKAARTAFNAMRRMIEFELARGNAEINSPEAMAQTVINWYSANASHYHEHPMDKIFLEEFARQVADYTEEEK